MDVETNYLRCCKYNLQYNYNFLCLCKFVENRAIQTNFNFPCFFFLMNPFGKHICVLFVGDRR